MLPPRTLALAGVIAACVFATPAQAQEAQARQLDLSRYDLATDLGAEAALGAIAATARQVCRSENRHGAGFEQALRTCTSETVARTVAQIDAPRLSALHAGVQTRVRLASSTSQGAS